MFGLRMFSAVSSVGILLAFAPLAPAQLTAAQQPQAQAQAAQQPQAQATQQPQAPQQEVTPTVVVLDASGSMLEQDVDGLTRMDAAKQAVGDFLHEVPQDAPLGLVTYGTGTGSSDEEKEAGCRDISVLARPGEKSTTDLESAVNGLQPRGYTPIGNALKQANDLLPKEGARSIVLVSDGIDTCAPPPVCDVAKELKAQGTELVVHTIGFKVDDAARAELSCVADVTGGTYADASTKETLQSVLTQATTRTGVGYQLPETTIKAGRDRASAPELPAGTLQEPARFRLETVSEAEEVEPGQQLLKVNIPKGHRLHIGGIAVPELGTGKGTLVGYSFAPKLLNSKEFLNVCSMNTGGDSILAGADRPVSFFASSKLDQTSEDCQEGELYLNLGLDRTDYDKPINIDMAVALVPEPSELGDPLNEKPSEERAEEAIGDPLPASEIKRLVAGIQPNNAPELIGTTEGEIVEGETQFFAVPVEYGQSIKGTVEVLVDPGLEDAQEGVGGVVRNLNIWAVNELGQKQELVGETSVHTSTDPKPYTFASKYDISYANIDADGLGQTSFWLGGKQYVAVSFTNFAGRDTDAQTQLKPLKYRITLETLGDAVQGPTFDSAKVGTTKPSNTTTSASPSDQAAKPTSTHWLWIALGIGAVIALAVLAGILALLLKQTRK